MELLLQKLHLKSEKLSKKLTNLRGQFLILLLGILLLSYGGFNYYKVRILSFKSTPMETSQVQGELPVQITIPSINIDMPVETGSIKNGVWEISYNSPTFLLSSARPGTGGNIVIYGHNKKAIFGNLPYLSLGQKIYIKDAKGSIRAYEAYQKDFVEPNRIDLVSPTNKEELTIYTCWGLFDRQRVVIKAKPLF